MTTLNAPADLASYVMGMTSDMRAAPIYFPTWKIVNPVPSNVSWKKIPNLSIGEPSPLIEEMLSVNDTIIAGGYALKRIKYGLPNSNGDIDFYSSADASRVVSIMEKHGMKLYAIHKRYTTYGSVFLLRFSKNNGPCTEVSRELPSRNEVIEMNRIGVKNSYSTTDYRTFWQCPEEPDYIKTIKTGDCLVMPDGSRYYAMVTEKSSGPLCPKSKNAFEAPWRNEVPHQNECDVILTAGYETALKFVEQEFELDIVKAAILKNLRGNIVAVAQYPDAIANGVMSHAFHPEMSFNCVKVQSMFHRLEKYGMRGFREADHSSWSKVISRTVVFLPEGRHIANLVKEIGCLRATIAAMNEAAASKTSLTSTTTPETATVKQISYETLLGYQSGDRVVFTEKAPDDDAHPM